MPTDPGCAEALAEQRGTAGNIVPRWKFTARKRKTPRTTTAS